LGRRSLKFDRQNTVTLQRLLPINKVALFPAVMNEAWFILHIIIRKPFNGRIGGLMIMFIGERGLL